MTTVLNEEYQFTYFLFLRTSEPGGRKRSESNTLVKVNMEKSVASK